MLKDNSLKAIIGMIAFAAVLLGASQRVAAQSLSAQVTDKDIMVSEFNAVNVSDDFDVTISRGTYGVRLTVDKERLPMWKYMSVRRCSISPLTRSRSRRNSGNSTAGKAP